MAGHVIKLTDAVSRWLGRASDAIASTTWSTSNTVFSILRRITALTLGGFLQEDWWQYKFDFGDESGVTAAAATGTVTVKVTDTIVAQAYTLDADSKGYIRAGRYQGSKIVSWGTAKEFEAGATTLTNMVVLDAEATAPTVAMAYVDGGDTNAGKLIVCSINVATLEVTTGTASAFSTANTTGNATRLGICKAADGKIAVAYRNEDHATDAAEARAVMVSGVVIGTWGTLLIVNVTASTNVLVKAVDNDKVVFTYTDVGGLNLKVAALSGTTFGTPGTEKVITTDTTIVSPVMCSPEGNMVVLVFQDGDVAGDPMYGVVCSISTTTLYEGRLKALTAAATTEIDVKAVSDSRLAVTFVLGARAYVANLMIRNGELFIQDAYVWNDAASLSASIDVIDDYRLLLGGEDDGGADYAVVRIGVLTDARKKLHGGVKQLQGTTVSATEVTLLEVWGSGEIIQLAGANTNAVNWTLTLIVDGLETIIVVSAAQASVNYVLTNIIGVTSADEFIVSTTAGFLNIPFRNHLKITALTSANTLAYKALYVED